MCPRPHNMGLEIMPKCFWTISCLAGDGPPKLKEGLAMASSSLEFTPVKGSFPHIAVIDEDSAFLDYVRESLGNEFNIHLFSCPTDLQEKFESAPPPDLVLLDCRVGCDSSSESAFSLLSHIRKSKPLVPVVMLSCSGDTNELLRATRMGAAGFLLKPIHKHDIHDLVHQYLGPVDPTRSDVKEILLDDESSFVRASR